MYLHVQNAEININCSIQTKRYTAHFADAFLNNMENIMGNEIPEEIGMEKINEFLNTLINSLRSLTNDGKLSFFILCTLCADIFVQYCDTVTEELFLEVMKGAYESAFELRNEGKEIDS
jgi:hypothetical protein